MDSENDKNFEPKEASGLPNQEDYHDPNEVTLDDFFDKVTVKKKETPKIFLIPLTEKWGKFLHFSASTCVLQAPN